jgi:hypothetical protein
MKSAILRIPLLVLAGAALVVATVQAESITAPLMGASFGDGSAITPTGVVLGSGNISFDGSVADGTYLLSNLTGLSVTFSIGGETFNNANMDTSNFPHVEVVIYGGGADYYFSTDCTSTPSDTSCYGPKTGSLDFNDSSNGSFFTTEPNYVGPAPLDLFMASVNVAATDPSYMGIYGQAATSPVPEPASLLLIGSGLAAIVARRRRA